jgi:hypothetical protein
MIRPPPPVGSGITPKELLEDIIARNLPKNCATAYRIGQTIVAQQNNYATATIPYKNRPPTAELAFTADVKQSHSWKRKYGGCLSGGSGAAV